MVPLVPVHRLLVGLTHCSVECTLVTSRWTVWFEVLNGVLTSAPQAVQCVLHLLLSIRSLVSSVMKPTSSVMKTMVRLSKGCRLQWWVPAGRPPHTD